MKLFIKHSLTAIHSLLLFHSAYLMNSQLSLTDITYMTEKAPKMIFVSCFLPIKDGNELPSLRCHSVIGQILFFLRLMLFSSLRNEHQSVKNIDAIFQNLNLKRWSSD